MKKYKCIEAFDISNVNITGDGIELEGYIRIKTNSLWEIDEELNFINVIIYLRCEDSYILIYIMD